MPQDESAFRKWYAEQAKKYDLNPNPDDPNQFYDYRAAFRAGAKPDETMHWPSQFKLPGHPNMVVGGFHVQTGERVPGTKQATTQELIDLGWDPEFAQTHGSEVQPFDAAPSWERMFPSHTSLAELGRMIPYQQRIPLATSRKSLNPDDIYVALKRLIFP